MLLPCMERKRQPNIIFILPILPLTNRKIYDNIQNVERRGSAGTGRQARLRGVCASVWVQVPSAAPFQKQRAFKSFLVKEDLDAFSVFMTYNLADSLDVEKQADSWYYMQRIHMGCCCAPAKEG